MQWPVKGILVYRAMGFSWRFVVDLSTVLMRQEEDVVSLPVVQDFWTLGDRLAHSDGVSELYPG